ncbi:hypothetical protein WMY93_023528 [Mugilogobius chulae]|uniref:C2H2-type domain-containing protein n=1 Tax=Mugilogobius chulae TaxID=88201 RepID=A0AAW0NEF1_9GOBI
MQHFKDTHIDAAKPNGQHAHEQHQDHKIQEKKTVSSVKASEDTHRRSDRDCAGTKSKSVKRYSCRHCDQSFNFTTSLRKHIRKDHNERRKNFVCWHCTETTTFTSSVMLKNHMSLMHGIKNVDFDQTPNTLNQESIKPMKKSRGSPVLGVKTDERTGDAPAEKRLKMCFRCAKCGFVTSDGQEFEQHIPQHKLEESTPQCGHCGLCFTSALALNRHLYIVHKVREAERRHLSNLQAEDREEHLITEQKQKPGAWMRRRRQMLDTTTKQRFPLDLHETLRSTHLHPTPSTKELRGMKGAVLGFLYSFIIFSLIPVTSSMSLDLTELRNKVSKIKVNPRGNLWATGHFMGKKSVVDSSSMESSSYEDDGHVKEQVLSSMHNTKDMSRVLLQLMNNPTHAQHRRALQIRGDPA